MKFIDLFAGIGGFHLGLYSIGGECVFVSEWDYKARITYEENFKEFSPDVFKIGLFSKGVNLFEGDITKVDEKNIPKFDILCAGFPCQPFSNAGLKKGFEDSRGTLFFDIVRIVKHHKPKVVFLENVKGFGYSLFDENLEYTSTMSARYYKDGSEILVKQKKRILEK